MAQLVDTCWANGLWADTVWASGVWASGSSPEPEPEPDPTPSGGAGGPIVAGTFTRKKWRSIADAKRARQEAEDHARSLKTGRLKAIQEATEKAEEAIAAAERGTEEETILRLERMTQALDAARNATALADAIREAQQTALLADAVMRAIEDEQREEEAVVSLLLL